MFPRSFSFRIFFLNFGLLILPLLFYFLLIFRWEFHNKVEGILFELKDIGNAKTALISEKIAHDLILIDFIEASLDFSEEKEVVSTFEKVNKTLLDSVISYYPADDKALTSKSDVVKNRELLDGYLEEAKTNGISIHLVYAENSNLPLLFVAKALYSKEHVPRGVFVVESFVQNFLKELVDPKTFGFDARFSVLTEKDIVFLSSDPTLERKALWPLPEERLKIINATKQFGSYPIQMKVLDFSPIKGNPDAFEWEEGGILRMGILIPVKGSSLVLLLDTSKDAIHHEIYHEIGKLLFFFSVIIVLLALLNLWIIKRLSEPLNQLFAVMVQIGKGNYKTRYKNDKLGYEINTIGTTLNQMTESLVHYMDTVKNELIKKETLSKELAIGREIQMSMLPEEMPKVDGVQIKGFSMPSPEVGGDFYDVYFLKNSLEHLFVTIGDSFGKGISSCLYSFGLRSMLRSYGMQYHDVSKMMLLANNLFYKDTMKSQLSVRVFSFIYNPKTYELEYGSASHAPLIIFKKTGKVERLNTSGEPLGLKIIGSFEKGFAKLEKGDILFLYVEGVMKLFGEDKIIAFIQERNALSADQIMDELYREFETYFKEHPQKEDIMALLMKV